MVFFPALYRPLGCYQTAYHTCTQFLFHIRPLNTPRTIYGDNARGVMIFFFYRLPEYH